MAGDRLESVEHPGQVRGHHAGDPGRSGDPDPDWRLAAGAGRASGREPGTTGSASAMA